MDRLSRVTGATLDVLRALRAEGDAVWGLKIVRTTGRAPGTVYPILERLERAGWVESVWESDDARPGPRRRLYRFTPSGAEAAVDLIVERSRLRPARTAALGGTEGAPT